MTARGLACSSLLALAAALVCQPARASPIDDLIEPVEGKNACFTRIYDAGHLRRRPQQKTRAITVWLSYEPIGGGIPGTALNLGLEIVQRGDRAALYSSGGCEWSERANRDTSNNRLIKTFRKEAGAVCLQSARPDVFETVSAQEGGSLILDRGRDSNTLMLYLDDSLIMVKRASRGKLLDVKFGGDDRTFMLRRADLKECAAVIEALTTLEPGVRRPSTRER